MSDELTTAELLGEAWMQLGHSANMVADLPLHLAADDLPRHVRHACAESFMVNAALIARFVEACGIENDGGPTIDMHLADQHVTRYGRARLDDPLLDDLSFEVVKSELLDLLSVAVDGHERLEAVVADAMTRTEPMT